MQGTLPYALSGHGHTGVAGVGDSLIRETTETNTSKMNLGSKQRIKGRNAVEGGISNVSMELIGSGMSNNSEWILFSPYDEEEEDEEEGVEAGSILSTRLSSQQSPLKHGRSRSFGTNGYVISDFDYSLESENVTEDMESSATDNGNDDVSEDELGVGEDEEYDDEDDDSLIGDVRNGIQDVQRSHHDELESKKHDELVSKINRWKHSVKVVNGGVGAPEIEEDGTQKNEKKTEVKPEKRRISRKDHKAREREIKLFKNAVGRLCTSLKKDRLVEHEGVFMNNPELESCIPGYWKRMMLDNLIQYSAEPGAASLGYNILGDDLKAGNRNFWEHEESISIQSVSTGWEGGSILGF